MNKRELSKILKEDFNGFINAAESAKEGVADFFVEVDDHSKKAIDGFKSEKRKIDANIKELVSYSANIRSYLLKFMRDNDIAKFDGVKTKSITYQYARVVTIITPIKQIMLSGTYVALDKVSKDDLVKMLELKGVRTRVLNEEEEVAKDASIRVLR